MNYPFTRSGSNDFFSHVLICISTVGVLAVNISAIASLV